MHRMWAVYFGYCCELSDMRKRSQSFCAPTGSLSSSSQLGANPLAVVVVVGEFLTCKRPTCRQNPPAHARGHYTRAPGTHLKAEFFENSGGSFSSAFSPCSLASKLESQHSCEIGRTSDSCSLQLCDPGGGFFFSSTAPRSENKTEVFNPIGSAPSNRRR